jgi:hypothetical protein
MPDRARLYHGSNSSSIKVTYLLWAEIDAARLQPRIEHNHCCDENHETMIPVVAIEMLHRDLAGHAWWKVSSSNVSGWTANKNVSGSTGLDWSACYRFGECISQLQSAADGALTVRTIQSYSERIRHDSELHLVRHRQRWNSELW